MQERTKQGALADFGNPSESAARKLFHAVGNALETTRRPHLVSAML